MPSDFLHLARPEVHTQPVYEPGRPIEDVAREFGLAPGDILKLASNENPLGPSPMGVEAARKALAEGHLYPDGGCVKLREKLAAHLGLAPGNVVVGNGSNEVMVMLAQAFLQPGQEAVMGAHAFIAFKLAVLLQGGTPVEVPMPDLRHDLDAMRAAVTPRTRLVYLPNPNNPTGDFHESDAVIEFAQSLPDHVILCYDEAYIEYLRDRAPDLRPLLEEGRAVLVTRTFSKVYGLPATRIGYGYGPEGLVSLIHRVRQPFNVNAIAQAAALAALDDHDYVKRSLAVNAAGQKQLADGLNNLGLKYSPCEGNFLLLETADAKGLFTHLQRRGIIIRPVGGYGLPGYVRVSIGTEAMNARLLDVLDDLRETPLFARA